MIPKTDLYNLKQFITILSSLQHWYHTLISCIWNYFCKSSHKTGKGMGQMNIYLLCYVDNIRIYNNQSSTYSSNNTFTVMFVAIDHFGASCYVKRWEERNFPFPVYAKRSMRWDSHSSSRTVHSHEAKSVLSTTCAAEQFETVTSDFPATNCDLRECR